MTVEDALKRESNNLDLFRILLAAAVIFGHTFYLNEANSRFWADPIRDFTVFTYSGALAVKLFFFISGLVVTNSLLNKQNPVSFLIARLFRVLPGLLFVVFLSALVICPFLSKLSYTDYFKSIEVYKYIIGNSLLNLRTQLPGVFKNNLYPDVVNGSLWSLRYEFGCYLGLLAIFITTKKSVICNLLIFIIAFDSLIFPHFFLHFLGHSRDSHLLPLCFAIGALFAVNSKKIYIRKRTLAILFVIFLLLKNTSYAEVALILFCCYTILLLSANRYICRLRLRYDISYGIYLWGFFIQQILFSVWGPMHSAWHFIIALALSVAIAFVSYIFVEKPCIQLGRQLSEIAVRKMEKWNGIFIGKKKIPA